MAIQIWSDGQYKSVDLAQYGADGALSGAYVWRDGAWRTLWERVSAPGYTWSDDFTSPALHERWQLLAGDYAPPGLTDAAVVGPDMGDAFEVTVDGMFDGGMITLLVLDSEMNIVVTIQIDHNVLFAEMGTDTPSPGGPVTLRRAGGHWSVLHGGQVLVSYDDVPLSIPDTHSGPAVLAIEAQDATVTLVGYTEL